MKTAIVPWLWIWMVFLLGCSAEEPVTGEQENRFSYKDQEFEIITYEQEYRKYMEEMETGNLTDSFHAYVLEPFRIQAFGENEGYSLVSAEDWHFLPPENRGSLKKTVDYLDENEAEILNTIRTAIEESVDELPGEDKDIHIFPSNPDNTDGMSRVDDLSGVTWNDEFMLITIGRRFSETELKQLVAHEYHHMVYNESNEPRYTLQESAVVEGKAEYFAHLLYPESESSFTEPLRGRYQTKTVDLFLEYADSTDPSVLGDFFYGHPGHDIPPRSLYRIGYQILEGFMEKHPDFSVEEWTNVSSERVVQESGITSE